MSSTLVEIGDFVFTLRLANACAIERAFGPHARAAALDHIKAATKQLLHFVKVQEVTHDQIVFLCPTGLMSEEITRRLIDSLCIRISIKPFDFAKSRILLAIDAGYSAPSGQACETIPEALQKEAQDRLKSSEMRMLVDNPFSPMERDAYRKDMKQASSLLRAIGLGNSLFQWRTVCHACDPEHVMHYEAIPTILDEKGQPADFEKSYQALKRLGLSYLYDRQMVCHVLDELEAAPNIRLSVAISSSSLSFDFNGKDIGWLDVLLRLKQNRDLAERFTIEITEPTPDFILPSAKTFIEALRAAGVLIAIAGFGSCFSSIRQLLTFQPDIIKLPSSFLQNRKRLMKLNIGLRHLIHLANNFSGTVVVDGVSSVEDAERAIREGAKWLAFNDAGPKNLPHRTKSRLCYAYKPYLKDSEILRHLHNTAGHFFPCNGKALDTPSRKNTYG